MQMSAGNNKNTSSQSSYFSNFTVVVRVVSVFCVFFFGESPLTPTSTLERKYWFEFLKCWPHEGSVEMHQLRAGRHKCQPCFTYSRGLFVLCNYSFCLPTLPSPSPSSAVLLNQSILASDDLVPAIRSCVSVQPRDVRIFCDVTFCRLPLSVS